MLLNVAQMIRSASEIENLARKVEDNGGVYFVPAFAGLLAPHWRGDARGLLCGLTAYNTKAHIARAVLESTAFQVRMGSRFGCLLQLRYFSSHHPMFNTMCFRGNELVPSTPWG